MSSRKHPVAHIFELAWRRGSESVPSEHSEVPQGHTDYQRMEVFRHSAICRSLVVLQNQTISAYLFLPAAGRVLQRYAEMAFYFAEKHQDSNLNLTVL